ncbi:glycoside hydrolase family 130 protein [Lentisphaera profundi]|uniref:Glycoside hydrolase family 130 protein n=1 Tax=Lentisphaera profundi TaxID=1658616 RepID=A0ABY7VXN7_9BACT|nr:glycoside hydrolase family 130 protein [Lentisphaera profundi]WDE99021.1 glycoside hydrolase family 130 protein [Lentisphaera profundi]
MDIAKRFTQNPLIQPEDILASVQGAEVECLLNPGVFKFEGKTYLLMRVAERMKQREGYLSTLVVDPTKEGGVSIVEFALDDPKLCYDDARVFSYDGKTYLTTLSHLRLAESEDCINFKVQPKPLLLGLGEYEDFGMEDCRVTQMGELYILTYTAVSEYGPAVGKITTRDWKTFTRDGIMLAPPNKDCAIFEEIIDDKFWCLHRPVVKVDSWSELNIWLASSSDMEHWGNHICLAKTRPGMWDSQRIGAGAAPIRTEQGWLEIYHGCDETSRYCLGALLLDLSDPRKVIARSEEPIMEPLEKYEQQGFFGNVVFTNGHLVDGDCLTLYYGASDTVICAADLSIKEILQTLLS